MKKIKLFLTLLSSIFLLTYCSKNEQVFKNPTLITQSEEVIVTNDSELNSLLREANLFTHSLTLKEKMNFLSNHIVANLPKNTNKSMLKTSDEIICVAQVFDGTLYFTQVKTGTSNQSIYASKRKSWQTPPVFAGVNANIYKKRVNVSGSIDKSEPCTPEDPPIYGVEYYASAVARYTPSNNYYTYANYDCQSFD
ncbi:exported hypothetical protein [Tenacibaculum sp. 190524A02b]|uniref:Lipoprotein n=1 Tax=Tenacibaculum vairaonense TaxID=3137860 RepID=A0ABM9PPG2_9FLAO